MAAALYILLLFHFIHQTNSLSFSYTGFNQSNLELQGSAQVTQPFGALRLTDFSKNVIGHAFHPSPMKFFTKNSSTSSPINVSSFSTYFIFAIDSPDAPHGGFGFAFTLSPQKDFPGAEPGHYMGIFNSTNDAEDSNHILAVEFDTVNGLNEGSDTDGNHIGINVNGMDSIASEPVAYLPSNDSDKKEEFSMESGDPIQVWIDFDGDTNYLNITIAPLNVSKPRPLKSRKVNLPGSLLEEMYIGFSAATGHKTSSHYILGWNFTTEGTAPPIDISNLPFTPKTKKRRTGLSSTVKALLGALSSSIVLLFGALAYFIVYQRRMGEFDRLEDWEMDYPHRFKYKDLHLATKGFNETELIGTGGFGSVYKGVLPSSGSEVAVKKIRNDSVQGMREFVAEIESLGRLRHKNLVNLQGWCKRKNKLLLIYDYIPRGSLYTLLLKPRVGCILRWDQRMRIMNDVAAGLLYLHHEWEQVVIHRDVKASNVLIDRDMGARLGDFGLARLYSHGQNSHNTKVVGTIGYIAPELAKTGSSSTSSDVFAFGVVVLEIVCGRGPIIYDVDHDHMMLVDWIIEHLQRGETDMIDFVDTRLGGEYDSEEARKVLRLGLVCCHPDAKSRPSMRQVTRYLDGDDSIPRIEEDLRYAISIYAYGSMRSQLGSAISTDDKSSPLEDVSFNSLEIGR
ncbi:lectin-domain containing receptor kinase VI.4-like [Impatiens glandulifera]|uniref:lectin-domain containing receptor kinase VI.4-like n=1 Tax=Impatiens glandulifera TaxID=253017 RepID=UPI001FB0C619|nr:lectin-domain containing receptor kinase VI.4-like [Impatiens glandulifera]